MPSASAPAIDIVRSAALGPVPHGFLGRRGGVSRGLYASLNARLGSDDDSAAVTENRARAVNAVLPGAVLASCHQIHSPTTVTIAHHNDASARPEADAIVTSLPGVLLGVLAADCVPVLFADHAAGVVGAAHAGWKGALGGVTDSCIAAMVALGADRARIAAAIGPCIARASYEVRDAFADTFAQADPANERFFTAGKPGHQHFDIAAYVAHRIAAQGVRVIDTTGIDTLTNPDTYFSYRRATLRGEAAYGCQLSLIGLDPTGT